jgi:ABC-type phosphate transport system permease subunit
MSEWRDLPVQPGDGEVAPAGPDYLGVTAIILGCLGIVAFGLFLAVPVAILSAMAGAKAKAEGRSLDNAVIGLVLAAVDGVVWVVLHLLIDFATWAG